VVGLLNDVPHIIILPGQSPVQPGVGLGDHAVFQIIDVGVGDTAVAHTSLTLFCPRKSCKCYQSAVNTITKDGVYITKSDSEPRQMFYCNGGKHRFSETGYSDLFGKHGSFKEYEQTAKLSSYGLGTDAIADVLQKDRRTIEQWQKAIGQKGQQFHLFLCFAIGLTIVSHMQSIM